MHIAVYGSLRKGEYNCFFDDKCTYVGRYAVLGYNLYNLGAYPAIYPTLNKKARLTVELWDIPKDYFNQIKHMEEGAGYHEEKVKLLPNVYDIPIYVYNSEPYGNIIKSGDWKNKNS